MSAPFGPYSTWVLAALLLGLVASIVAFVIQFRQARKAKFFYWRQEAARRARWLALVILLLLIASGALAWMIGQAPAEPPTVAETPSPSPSPTARGRPPTTVAPTPLGSPPVTPVPSLVLTLTPTRIPTPAIATKPSFIFVTFAEDVSADNQPVRPAETFPPMQKPVYAFFQYAAMQNGTPWTMTWLRDGVELASETTEWGWGAYGTAFIFYQPPGGYEAGRYLLRAYIGDELQFEADFEVR